MSFHNFLRLPLELRELVYASLVAETPVEYTRIEPKQLLKDNDTEQRVGSIALQPASASKYPILHTCRSLATEFRNYVFIRAPFVFTTAMMTTSIWRAWAVQERTLSRMRHLVFVHHRAPFAHGHEICFEKLVEACGRLRSIEVEVWEGDDMKGRWEVPKNEWSGSWIV